ncbi:MAG: SusC/RagA family TonB-linked outer membrane protein, partial [Bacteroidales bacterium]|nr:SusC/RagA family TonB-linked outer membrane protein [Bacteroidales bacterium]
VGELSNKGVELTINWTVMQRGDLRWDVNLSMARNIMKIEKLSGGVYETDAVQSGSLHGLRGMSNQYAQTIREGYAVGTFWGQECTGLNENGKFLDVNGNVLDSQADSLNKDLGNPQPKFTLGFSTGLTYKNFDLSISAYGFFGHKVLNATAMSMNDQTRFPALNVPHKMFNDSITSAPTFSSYWIEDASFFRLQSVTLGYSFHFKNIGIERLRLYVMGENLFVITQYSGLDPEIKIEEYDSSTGKMDALRNPGIDRYDIYPRPRTVSVGINLLF